MRALLTLLCLLGSSGHPEYRDNMPNGANVPRVAAVGHQNPGGGGALNSFGDDYAGNSGDWSQLCEMDSDGDSQTNGMELGDPCCVWSVGGVPLCASQLSNPGDPTSTTSRPEYDCKAVPAPPCDMLPSPSPQPLPRALLTSDEWAAVGGATALAVVLSAAVALRGRASLRKVWPPSTAPPLMLMDAGDYGDLEGEGTHGQPSDQPPRVGQVDGWLVGY